MLKTEILCENCDTHYIIVTIDEDIDPPTVCPFCSSFLIGDDDAE